VRGEDGKECIAIANHHGSRTMTPNFQEAAGRSWERTSEHHLPLTDGDTELALGDRLLALLALGPPRGGVLDVIRGVLFVRHGYVVVVRAQQCVSRGAPSGERYFVLRTSFWTITTPQRDS
jgi:hypothetical protein